jgi:flavin-dependent dehydrogenase
MRNQITYRKDNFEEWVRCIKEAELVANFDVAVIGAGPAGCATALFLSRYGMSVVLISQEQPRLLAGETLSPAGEFHLRRLDLQALLNSDHMRVSNIASQWDADGISYTDVSMHPLGSWWHLNRYSFDKQFQSEVDSAGVPIIRATYRSSEFDLTTGRWCLIIVGDPSIECIKSRFVVDASGRRASFARQQGAKSIACDALVGIIACISHCSELAYRGISVEAASKGWWYTSFAQQDEATIGLFTDSDLFSLKKEQLRPAFLSHLRATKLTRARMGSLLDLASGAALRVIQANTRILNRVCGENWLAVGDAALTMDPLSSQGITQSLLAAERAAKSIVEHLESRSSLDSYVDFWLRETNQYLCERAMFYSRQSNLKTSFWCRRSVLRDFGKQTLFTNHLKQDQLFHNGQI